MKSTTAGRPDPTPTVPPRLVEPEVVHDACRELGLTYRKRLLDPLTTLHLLLVQALHGNTALHDLRFKTGVRATAGAICRARARLPLAFFHAVLSRLGRRWQDTTAGVGTWLGHRVLFVDGSGCSMPDVGPLRRHYGQPAGQEPGCGFPVARLLGIVHAGTGLILEWLDAPLFASEQAMAADAVARLRPDDLLVGDRAFGNYPALAALVRLGIQAVMRVNQCVIVNFTPGRPHTHPKSSKPLKGLPRSCWIRALGACDQVVDWLRPAGAAYAALPANLRLREVRYRVETAGFRTREVTLVTTLVDAVAYPAEELAKLYFRRWEVEGHFRSLKTTMKMDILKCKTVDGIRKEMAVYALAYNLARLSALEASRRQGVEVSRVSFVDALRWLATTAVKGWFGLPELVINPSRPGRAEPRVRKRRPKAYPLMTKPRAELKEALVKQGIAAY
jgi:hypothetical protein